MQRSHKDQVRQSGESFLQTAHTEGVMVIFKVRKILPKTCLLFLIRYAASKAVCKRQLQRPSCLCHATLHSRTFLGAFGAAHDIHMCLRVFYTFFFTHSQRDTWWPLWVRGLLDFSLKVSLKAPFLPLYLQQLWSRWWGGVMNPPSLFSIPWENISSVGPQSVMCRSFHLGHIS